MKRFPRASSGAASALAGESGNLATTAAAGTTTVINITAAVIGDAGNQRRSGNSTRSPRRQKALMPAVAPPNQPTPTRCPVFHGTTLSPTTAIGGTDDLVSGHARIRDEREESLYE